PALGAPQAQRPGAAPPRAAGPAAEQPHGRVDGVLGHLAVGGELAAGDGDQPAVGHGDPVAAGQVGGAAAGGVADEGAQAGPGAEHVVLGQRAGDGVVDGLEQVGDVLGRALRVVEVAVVVGVGGADVGDRPGPADRAVLAGPRHDEDRPPVAPHGQDGGDVVADLLPGHGDVDALGRPDAAGVGALGQGPHLVAPHAGGVDDDPGPDLDLVAVDVDPGAADLAALGDEPGDRRVVDDGGAVVEGRGAQHGEGEPGVVGLGVVVEVGPGQALVERGHVGERPLARQPPVHPADAQPAGEVVHPHGRAEGPGDLAGDDAALAGE